MTENVVVKPLGLVLRKAGLISSEQVEKALKESLVLPQCKIGEILAIRGWIKPETADFFAEMWPRILQGEKDLDWLDSQKMVNEFDLSSSLNHTNKVNRGSSQQKQLIAKTLPPLGQYLKAANLINDKQITHILNIQHHNSSKFGKIAVEKGLISQTTLEFFLEHLNLLKTGKIIKTYPEKLALELDRIERYLLNNHKCEPIKLLQRYQEIKQRKTMVASGDLIEQELIASGILVLEKNILRIAKQDYGKTFDADWLEKELANLQPYNQIRFKMFALNDKADIPYKIINAINDWTEHQPFLTQKIYQLIQEQSNSIPSGEELNVVGELVYKNMIDNWDTGIAASHFQAICDRLYHNQFCSPQALLKTYKKIWQLKEINADNSLEQRELIQIGLISLNNNLVKVSNRIYQAVFNRLWLEKQLNQVEIFDSSLSEEKILTNPLPNVTQYSVAKNKNKFLFLLPLVALLIAIPFILKLFNNPKQPNQLLEKGHFFLENQQYQKALHAYNELLKVQKAQATNQESLSLIYEKKGETFAKLQDYKKAISNYQQALNYNPHNLLAKQGLGLTLSKLGQELQANQMFESILQQSNITDQEKETTWLYWGQSLCHHGHRKLADSAFKKAEEFSTDDPVKIALAKKECI